MGSNHSFLWKNLNLISKGISNDYFEEVGDKIIYRRKKSNIFHIETNRRYLLKWGWGIILCGMVFNFALFGKAFVGQHTFGMILFFSFFTPFLATGIVYFIKASKSSIWVIDPDDKSFLFENKELPFSEVLHWGISDLQTASPYGGGYSYHLNLYLKNKNEITLFRTDTMGDLQFLMFRLAEVTGIPFNHFIQKA